MFPNLRPLVPVLALAWTMFLVMRPLCLAFMSAATFERRRKVWFALTIVAFLSPSFGLYALFAIALLWWAGKQETNPLGLYVLVTFVVPDARFYIPGLIVNQLFDLTQYRLLSLFVLAPAVFRGLSGRKAGEDPGLWTIQDTAFVAFLSIFVFTNLPYDSATGTMRRSFLFVLDLVLVFYAFSRLRTAAQVADVMAAFCVSVGIMGIISILEWSKGWLLYVNLANEWGDPNRFAWLLRGDRLRAQAAAQGPLNLGYHLAMALVFYVALRHRISKGWLDRITMAVLIVGLNATGSRGPWLTAAVGLLLYSFSRPNAVRHLARGAALVAVAVAFMYFTPLKESVLDRLPIIGTADQDTVEYRQQLASLSWTVIAQHPLFGDAMAWRGMESMRQGQGIIDIVNGYLWTLLFAGWIGMTLQAFGFLAGSWAAFKGMLAVRSSNADLGSIGAGLLAGFGATLFFVATAGYGPTTYLILGLLFSYARACRQQRWLQGTLSKPAPDVLSRRPEIRFHAP